MKEKAWKRGRITRKSSSSVKDIIFFAKLAFASKFACVRQAPLGAPVVPDV